MEATFLDLYRSDTQAVYALWVAPLLLLAYLLLTARGRATARHPDAGTRFVYRYAVAFGIETILDPLATGPLLRWLGIAEAPAGTAVLLAFVLLGDFRVFLLLFYFTRPDGSVRRAAREAAAWTVIVPLLAWAVDRALRELFASLPEQTLWLVYELAFLAMALWLRARLIPASGAALSAPLRRGLQAIAGYVALYYALWAISDALILAADLDAAWALRILPNHLYYSLYLPFVCFELSPARLSASPHSASNVSTQTSR